MFTQDELLTIFFDLNYRLNKLGRLRAEHERQPINPMPDTTEVIKEEMAIRASLIDKVKKLRNLE